MSIRTTALQLLVAQQVCNQSLASFASPASKYQVHAIECSLGVTTPGHRRADRNI